MTHPQQKSERVINPFATPKIAGDPNAQMAIFNPHALAVTTFQQVDDYVTNHDFFRHMLVATGFFIIFSVIIYAIISIRNYLNPRPPSRY
jgi:hypothetical protein